MFRANIYYLEPLPRAVQDAVHEGIEVVATNMDQRVLTTDLRVRLPVTNDGTVNPNRVGVKNFDKMVELHLMAIPLGSANNRKLGEAYFQRGVSFVNVAHTSISALRAATSHEVAHSFGFVKSGAQQNDEKSPNHCIDEQCTMHAEINVNLLDTYSYLQQLVNPSRGRLNRLRSELERLQMGYNAPAKTRLDTQSDFCKPCKRDLRSHGENHLNALRLSRLISGVCVVKNPATDWIPN